MTAAADNPIIVVGGGIGGMSAALGLAQLGLKVVLLEQAQEFQEVGAGLQLAPNAFAALDALNVGENVRSKSVFTGAWQVMDGVAGTMLFKAPLGDALMKLFGNPYAVLHRADLHTALLDAARETKLVEIRTKARVQSMEPIPGGISITLQSGEIVSGRALVGADGVHSIVRRALVEDRQRVSGDTIYRAVMPAERMPPAMRMDAVTLWMGPACHLMHYPIRGGDMYNIVAVFQSATPGSPGMSEGSREELLAHFGGIAPEPYKMILEFDSWTRWLTADSDPVEKWGKGLVTLLGDAGHPTLQYMGQGACMTLEDSVTLREAVRRSPGDLDTAFRLYESKRILRTARIVLSSRMMQRMVHLQGVERQVRNSIIDGLPPEQFYANLAWLWGWTAERCLA